MDLKFYLNKIIKIDNIEYYKLSQLTAIRKSYEKFLEESKGTDPDFPMINFGGNEGTKIKGVNKSKLEEENGSTGGEQIGPGTGGITGGTTIFTK